MPLPQPQLPVELVQTCIGFCSGNTLSTFLLVSSIVHDWVKPQLYRDLVFLNHLDWTKLPALLCSKESSPEFLTRHVQSLAFRRPTVNPYSSQEVRESTTARHNELALELFRAVAPNLRYLAMWEMFLAPDPQSMEVLREMRQLRVISFRDTHDWGKLLNNRLDAVPYMHLTHLDYGYGNLPSNESLCLRSAPSLTHIAWEPTTSPERMAQPEQLPRFFREVDACLPKLKTCVLLSHTSPAFSFSRSGQNSTRYPMVHQWRDQLLQDPYVEARHLKLLAVLELADDFDWQEDWKNQVTGSGDTFWAVAERLQLRQ